MFGLFIFLFYDWKFRVKIVHLFGWQCITMIFDSLQFWIRAFSASFEPISMNRIFIPSRMSAIDTNADFTAWPPGLKKIPRKRKINSNGDQPSLAQRVHSYKNKCKRPLTAFFKLFVGFVRECYFDSKKNLLLASRYTTIPKAVIVSPVSEIVWNF